MLNPDRIARFRQALAGDPGLRAFEGVPCHARILALDPAQPAEVLAEEDPVPLRRGGPARIFGTPADPACLDGVGERQVWLPSRRLLRVEDAAVIGNDAVLDAAGTLFCPEPVTAPGRARMLAGTHDSHGVVVTATDALRCHHFGRAEPRRIAADALFLHNIEPANYGSFLFRLLPQLLLAAHVAPRFDVYVTPDRTAFLAEALALLGLPRRPVYTVREVCGDAFRSVTLAGDDAEGLMPATVVDGLRALATRLGRVEGAPRSCRLWVSRALSTLARPEYRPLLNEDEAEALAAAHGFAPLYPETLTLAQQVACFAGAEAVAGPSGSGMLNAMFAPVGARVLDLESVHVTVRQHANVYACTGKRYAFAFGRPEGEAGDPIARAWRIDPDVLRDGLAWATAG